MPNVLFFGDVSEASTALHRANALIRLGSSVSTFNPVDALSKAHKSSIMQAINFKTGYRLLQSKMLAWLTEIVENTSKPDFIWVDNGEFFGKKCLQILQKFNCPIVLYSIDDPTGKRDGMRFDSMLSAIKFYDLIVAVRDETEEELKVLGAKKILKVWRSYDEIAHQPFEKMDQIPVQFRSEVAFIGTWMRHEKRDEFLLKLIDEGIPVAIWGNAWQKSKYFEMLKPYYRGPNLSGREYIAAIQGAKICLGLLSKGNRDLHTTRSLEVPYAGGILCAQRTREHQALYKENVEAVFWADAEECAQTCKALLGNSKIENLRVAGMQRVRSLKLGNEDLCKLVLKEINLAT
ncbi:CgeB family protein [Pedobacter mucosus]|uniref:CgeB family protein n=1 Tax=Pedobacter mucosus TaxID=2895286 RepID=UPI001EE43D6C|nr:glycosyltransferase [Pedobacter mucosus]UKT62244.1 glycosyltransferase [Pedobacter mucosus]